MPERAEPARRLPPFPSCHTYRERGGGGFGLLPGIGGVGGGRGFSGCCSSRGPGCRRPGWGERWPGFCCMDVASCDSSLLSPCDSIRFQVSSPKPPPALRINGWRFPCTAMPGGIFTDAPISFICQEERKMLVENAVPKVETVFIRLVRSGKKGPAFCVCVFGPLNKSDGEGGEAWTP